VICAASFAPPLKIRMMWPCPSSSCSSVNPKPAGSRRHGCQTASPQVALLRVSRDREQRFQAIVSTFWEVLDASADNSTGLRLPHSTMRKPDAHPEIVDAPDHAMLLFEIIGAVFLTLFFVALVGGGNDAQKSAK
jgi:hypothetical protein